MNKKNGMHENIYGGCDDLILQTYKQALKFTKV